MGGLPSSGTSRGEKVIVGGSSGILTLWEKGAWDDQDERIYVQRGGSEGGESVETLTTVPDSLGHGKLLAAGLGNGLVKFVRIGPNRIVSEVVHDETEGVVAVGFDVEGRMVSGGGQIVKFWHEAVGSGDGDGLMAGEKHMLGDGDSSDDDSDDDREGQQKDNNRKKRKKVKGKDRHGGQHVIAFHDMD